MADAEVTDDVTDDEVTDEAKATFGQDTAARAKLQQEAEVGTRKTFGTAQSATAKAKNDTADDGDDTTSVDDGSND